MKLNKIAAIALAALSMTACSDDSGRFDMKYDHEYNTNPATVSMEKTTMTAPEDIAQNVYYNVPVVVSGETNGAVVVNVKVESIGTTPAEEGKDYVVTSKSIIIPAGETVGNVEFYPIGDDVENQDRTFTVTIVSAEGATVEGNTTTLVTLLDNERLLPEAYAKVVGQWTATDDEGSYPVTIEGFAEGEPGYLKQVKLYGIAGEPDFEPITLDFTLDGVTGEVTLTMPFQQVVLKEASFRGIQGLCDVAIIGFDGQYVSWNGATAGTSNPEVTSFVFDAGFAGGIFATTPGGPYGSANFKGYIAFGTTTFSLSK